MAGVVSSILVVGTSAASTRYITKVEAVSVTTPVGNVPRLPYQLWVTYSDGGGEYRQVKWMNTSEAIEKAEADPTMNPVGTEYKVRGFVIGDNTTSNGYPVSAEVKVVDKGQWKVSSNIPVAEPLPLDKVSIDGKNRLSWNRDLDIDQLISMPVKQQLYNYRDTYGLSTDGYPEADVVVHVDYYGRIGLYLGFGLIWDVGLRFIAAAGSEGQWEQGQE